MIYVDVYRDNIIKISRWYMFNIRSSQCDF